MSTEASTRFEIQAWDEQTYAEIDGGGKLTRASVEQSFSGGVEGAGSVEWLMCYRADQTADFVGMQRVDGSLGGRHGTFIMRTSGTFDGHEAKGSWTVVEGSGTGELDRLRGEGEFAAPPGSQAEAKLVYDLG